MKTVNKESGQALVALLIFVLMGMAIATSATFIVIGNSKAAADFQQGIIARQMADSGIETAYLGLLRDPTGYQGETVDLNGGTIVIGVARSGSNITINSLATSENYVKEVETVLTYGNNVLTLLLWKEKI